MAGPRFVAVKGTTASGSLLIDQVCLISNKQKKTGFAASWRNPNSGWFCTFRTPTDKSSSFLIEMDTTINITTLKDNTQKQPRLVQALFSAFHH